MLREKKRTFVSATHVKWLRSATSFNVGNAGCSNRTETEQNRTEQNRTEQNRTETEHQNRNRTESEQEQNRTGRDRKLNSSSN